ncbi:unnamed protein product [Aureobasidium vineae]|uniref:T6SS Phospholipase effector Tle1-like catalytic domain-containing protein n=1 Tax=Aureobasidium vineae TaxID=2773715 RepID=A0A9N8JXH1_9PEZI|nr:unnamed protein product [Aureobasidium vineae]
MDSRAIAPSSSSAEKLIVFCDGTWCGPEHGTRTNIQLLAEMAGIDMDARKGSREIQDTSRRLRAKYFNGITCNYLTYGLGASPDNIGQLCLEIYRYIARYYTDRTEIWLFGLGRGAYALRCVVGMIDNCGIVKSPTDELCGLVYQTYASPRENDRPSSDHSADFRRRASWEVASPIKIMVLLDTVGSVSHGCISTGTMSSNPILPNEIVPSVVEKVLHACSIHDRLPVLQPCLATKADHNTTPQIYETWFPGCHYDIGRQSCRFFPRGWLFLAPRLLSGVIEPNHVLSNAVLCWALQSVVQQFPSQTVFQDTHWQIAFLKTSIQSPATSTGSGDVYQSSKTSLYAPFGRILTRLPIIPAILESVVSVLPFQDRRIPDYAADIIDFESPYHPHNDKSLAQMARVDSQRYPSRTYEAWKTWTKHTATTKDKKAISWADDPVALPDHNTKPLQIEPKPLEDPYSYTPRPSPKTTYKNHINASSPSRRRDSADPRPRHQRSSSLLQNTVLTASDDTLMKAVINSDTSLVQDLLAQKASELAFDFEWLSELIELGYSVEEIAAVLVEEEKKSPWLVVSGGNFGKRALKMAKRLGRKKKAENSC